MAGIQLDDAVMRDVVTAAIVKTLTEESRAVLIQQAVATLLSPVASTGYNADRRSQLQVIFEQAAYEIARKEVATMLRDDPKVVALFRDLIAKGLEKAIEDTSLVSNLAAALSKAFASGPSY